MFFSYSYHRNGLQTRATGQTSLHHTMQQEHFRSYQTLEGKKKVE